MSLLIQAAVQGAVWRGAHIAEVAETMQGGQLAGQVIQVLRQCEGRAQHRVCPRVVPLLTEHGTHHIHDLRIAEVW